MIIALGLSIMALMDLNQKPKKAAADNDGAGTFDAKPLLNTPERNILDILDALLAQFFEPGTRLFSQVCYGEFLRVSNQTGSESIAQSTADFVMADRSGKVICVIEYQGYGSCGADGKYRHDGEQQFHTRRAACRSANIPYAEVPSCFDAELVQKVLREALACTRETGSGHNKISQVPTFRSLRAGGD